MILKKMPEGYKPGKLKLVKKQTPMMKRIKDKISGVKCN
tara:strand:- start:952 stop:1068 length:117 start_codon:yes stop_codon:yes gene_type:complete